MPCVTKNNSRFLVTNDCDMIFLDFFGEKNKNFLKVLLISGMTHITIRENNKFMLSRFVITVLLYTRKMIHSFVAIGDIGFR